MLKRVLVLVVGIASCGFDPPWRRTPDVPEEGVKTARPDGGAASAYDAGSTDVTQLCEERPRKFLAPRTTGVVNGTRDPQFIPLGESQKLAIVALGFDGPSGSQCTGALVAERTILTAQHCLEGENPSQTWALFGPRDDAPLLAIRGVQKREHPTHDVALLQLESSPQEFLDVTPLHIALEELSDGDTGIQVENAGYGRTSADGEGDGLFFVVEQLVGFEEDGQVFVVHGGGDRGVCFGDSGGPSLRIAPTGEPRIIGVLSWGDESCVGQDRYARLDVARAWIEEWTGPTPGGNDLGCGLVTSEGQCSPSGTHAIWCDAQGRRVEEACGEGRRCQWTVEDGWRCGPTELDGCDGITAYGTCDGTVLRWCFFGSVATRPCHLCGEQCVLTDAISGFNCVPSSCGDLTYLGMCDGNVAVWCDHDGQRRSVDCSDDGEECGYVDPQTGFYCLDRGACDGLDYLGRCDGDVATWCEDGALHERDCAGAGEVCRYVDDSIGFYCAPP